MYAPQIEYGQGNDRQWYWRLRDSNGKIIADGSEGYVTEQNVLIAIKNVRETIPLAKLEKL